MIIQPRPFNPRKTITVLAVLLVATYFYYQRPPPLRLWKMSGPTMGTSYAIKLLDNRMSMPEVEQLKQDIDALLAEVNRQMSTYLPDSEINAFNAFASTDPFSVSPGFAEVAHQARMICVDTGGAFDPTVNRLIELWGFGPQGPQKSPDEADIEQGLARSGCDQFMVDRGTIRKRHPEVALNLNAIAKGWGVDEVASLLETRSITNYFIEIGGEVVARGQSEKVRSWRVGIDRPVEGAAPGEAYDLVVELDGLALATSGSYRNFVVNENGEKIAHILDPRTGRPATTRTVSVSVIARDCATADAAATALFVMGAEDGLSWVNARPEIEAVFMDYGQNGDLQTRFSDGFKNHLVKR